MQLKNQFRSPALEGILFLSDEVSQLREENERLRKYQSRSEDQEARIIALLRGEVSFLREVLTNHTPTMPVKAALVLPALDNADRSAISKQLEYSGEPLSNTLSPSHSLPAQDTSERRSAIAETASSAALFPLEGDRKSKTPLFGAI
ncbi:hypothetical protein MRX96_007699 [Rhipicephalus microplus]